MKSLRFFNLSAILSLNMLNYQDQVRELENAVAKERKEQFMSINSWCGRT